MLVYARLNHSVFRGQFRRCWIRLNDPILTTVSLFERDTATENDIHSCTMCRKSLQSKWRTSMMTCACGSLLGGLGTTFACGVGKRRSARTFNFQILPALHPSLCSTSWLSGYTHAVLFSWRDVDECESSWHKSSSGFLRTCPSRWYSLLMSYCASLQRWFYPRFVFL